MTASASEVYAKWVERHGQDWRDAGVRHAGRWARLVINQRLGLRAGLSRGEWSLGTGDLNGRSRREVDQERRDAIKAEVDALLAELGLAPDENPLRRVGRAQKHALIGLDDLGAPMTSSDLANDEFPYDRMRMALKLLRDRGFVREAGKLPTRKPHVLAMSYSLTDEGKALAAAARAEREAVA